jgi:hypothetical protein
MVRVEKHRVARGGKRFSEGGGGVDIILGPKCRSLMLCVYYMLCDIMFCDRTTLCNPRICS